MLSRGEIRGSRCLSNEFIELQELHERCGGDQKGSPVPGGAPQRRRRAIVEARERSSALLLLLHGNGDGERRRKRGRGIDKRQGASQRSGIRVQIGHAGMAHDSSRLL